MITITSAGLHVFSGNIRLCAIGCLYRPRPWSYKLLKDLSRSETFVQF